MQLFHCRRVLSTDPGPRGAPRVTGEVSVVVCGTLSEKQLQAPSKKAEDSY